jgi:hypothetical protein
MERDHSKWDKLAMAGYPRVEVGRDGSSLSDVDRRKRGRLVLITADDPHAQVDATLMRRRAELKEMDAAYAQRLQAQYDALREDPGRPLPSITEFRYRDHDFRELREFKKEAYRQHQAREAVEQRKFLAERHASNHKELERVLQLATTNPLALPPPPARFSGAQWITIKAARLKAFPASPW